MRPFKALRLKDSALLLVDVQKDFLPGGALGVKNGERIIAPINQLISLFETANRPIVATRDWHPENHCSFHEQQGPWPPHCRQNSEGAALSPDLRFSTSPVLISKGTSPDQEQYSGFEGETADGHSLHHFLQEKGVRHLYVAGLATDYCVLNTVLDALKLGYQVSLIRDGVAAVNLNEEDENKAFHQMTTMGAQLTSSHQLGGPGRVNQHP